MKNHYKTIVRGWFNSGDIDWGFITKNELNCMERRAMKLILLEVGDIGRPRFARKILKRWSYAHTTLYLGIKDYLEMEIETLQLDTGKE